MKKLKLFFSNEKGATAMEYGLIIALVALVISASLGNVSTGINNTFRHVKDTVSAP